ncbi:PilZ domain-containing protein [Gallaecimonas xiamenensis]|uniref:PilZ domain-containing protein n=1 Tax=Gallaecimonas xiamenensis TaxID=1207039 RepID=UPI00178C6E90|nr:PilZ domain-containing protein [Gallaecimonas xiamenensis]
MDIMPSSVDDPVFEIRSEFKDVSNHPIISQLRALVGEPEFESLFTQLTEDEDTNTRFLLRMELRRVAAPCQRVIDLRLKGVKRCQLVEHNGQTHYMDEGARRIFEAGLKEFAGRYTMAIYDDVERYAQAARKEGRQADDEEPEVNWLELVRFGSLLTRDSERMHFATPVLIRQGGMVELSGSTSDISLSGLQVHLADAAYINPETELELSFPKLTDANKRPWPPLRYQFISQQDQRIRLRLLDTEPHITGLIKALIEHNQRRYKLDIRHIQETTRSRGFEQMLLSHSPALPVFFDAEQRACYCLSTVHNQPLQQLLFKDELSLLSELLGPRRIKAMLARDESQQESYLLMFEHHQQGRVFPFAGELEQLREQGLLDGFLRFGVNKPGWRVLKVNLFTTHVQALAGLDQDPNTSGADLQLTDTPVAPVPKEIQELSCVALLRDVTQDWLTEAAQALPGQVQDPNVLAPYCIQWRPGIQRIAMRFNDMRIEPRFRYKTPVQLYFDGKTIETELQDFSTQGLCLRLNEPIDRLPSELDVALPKLQRLSTRFDLMQMPYRVVHYDQPSLKLHLMIQDTGQVHPAKRFFSQLISANDGRLQPLDEDESTFAIARALRQSIVASALPTCLFVQKHNGKVRPNWLGVPVSPMPLPRLLSRLSQANGGQVAMDSLMSHQQFRMLLQDWRDNQRPHQSLLVALDTKGLPVMSRLQGQLPGEEALRFLQQAREKGYWGVWLLEFARTPKPDMHFIQNDLNYISRQALHRAKRLEQDLWGTVAMVEVTDITPLANVMLGLKARS